MEGRGNNAWHTPREVSHRTGLSPATLRIWEERYGFPRPERLPSGHRRYADREVELLLEVVRERDEGRSLTTAVERVLGGEPATDESLFAGLRRRRPDLIPYVLAKRTLIALSHAIEDESCAHGDRGLIIGAFQREHFFRQAEERWSELARTADTAFALADFDELTEADGKPIEVPIDRSGPVGREWAIVCDGPEYSACLTAWERPGQEDAPDRDRLFETIWTVEPELVRDASRIGVGLTAYAAPELARRLGEELTSRPLAAEDSVNRVTALTSRMVAYLSGDFEPRQLQEPHA
jgi:DICT domain-containing protein/predicted DNA-binding transcriptional regulator AlpA